MEDQETIKQPEGEVLSPFVDSRKPVRVEYPGGLWWEFKGKLSYGDRCELKRPYVKMGLKGMDKLGEQMSAYAIEREQARLLLIASVGWNFPDPKRGGKTAAITLENILRLDEDTYIAPAIKATDALYGPNSGLSVERKNASVPTS